MDIESIAGYINARTEVVEVGDELKVNRSVELKKSDHTIWQLFVVWEMH
jgi:hypothetical protein